jgi:hypothetical protein
MGRTKELYEQMVLQDATNEFINNKFFYETLDIQEHDNRVLE